MTNHDDHRPDSPFGCAETWGPVLPAIPDGRLHTCTRDTGHQEKHTCKCGANPTGLVDRG